MSAPLRFWRGRHFYQIAPAYEGAGFMGICDGRVIAKAPHRAAVMRELLTNQNVVESRPHIAHDKRHVTKRNINQPSNFGVAQ